MTREPIYAALFALLQKIEGVNTFSRRLMHWNDVGAAQQPAIYQVQKKELQKRVPKMPAKVTLQCEIYLYVNTGNDLVNVVPSTELNPLMDAIEAAIEPYPGERQTLGGLVYSCFIDGEIETDEGVLGPQAIAIVPVTIVVNH